MCNSFFIYQEALKDPSVTDSKQKAAYLLGKALKAGVQKGRLMFAKHQPKNGGKNYRLVTKPNRRKILAKWSRHKKSVEYRDVDDFGKVSLHRINIYGVEVGNGSTFIYPESYQ